MNRRAARLGCRRRTVLGLALVAGLPRAAAQELREFMLVAFAEPVAGQEAEFNRWYDREHLPAMLAVPGMRSAERWQAAKADTPESRLPREVATYHAFGADWPAIDAGIRARYAEGLLRPSRAFDTATVVSLVYEPLGGALGADEVAGSTPAPRSADGAEIRHYAMFVAIDAVPGREAEFNRWYDEQHLPDVLRIPGFRSARRYRLIDARQPPCRSAQPMPKYLAWFEFDSTNLAGTIAELKRRVHSGITRMSDTLARGGQVYYLLPRQSS
ncbi:MAG: hypothetical protein KGN16_24465 [Burkholderiales bacterium]|nr:hypothetical protein [Burkholderiales bacterium]